MIGAALDQYVAGLEHDLAFIHQRNDLAGQHDRVVDRAGLVETWMAGISAIQGLVPSRAITLPFFGGGKRNGRRMESSLPRLSAGVPRVSHSSVTTTLPVPRLNTCGEGPSMMNIDLPLALCPVTTRRIFFCIRTSYNLREKKHIITRST